MMLIGVVAHVNREHLVDKLIRETQIDVVRFDDGVPSVRGCADNHIRVLKELYRFARADHQEWCVVIEDDARPVPDFRRQLKLALAHADTPLVGLYLGGGNLNAPTQKAMIPAVEAAKVSDSNWIVADWFISAVGYAVRSTKLSGLIEYVSDTGGPLDMRINWWTHQEKIQTWYTQPSLVDHLDEVSVIAPGIPIPARRAHRVGSRNQWCSSTTVMADAEPWGPGYATI